MIATVRPRDANTLNGKAVIHLGKGLIKLFGTPSTRHEDTLGAIILGVGLSPLGDYHERLS